MFVNIQKAYSSWGRKISYTLFDQGFFSGANFLVSLLLARYVNASVYGVFSITYSIFLFLSGIYNSLVLEPINVLGPKKHDNDLLAYKRQSIKLHFLITSLLTILGLLCTFILWELKIQPDYVKVSFFISLSFPFILFFWLARQCAYLETKPKSAFYGSLIYASIYIGFFLVLVFTHKIQVSYIFIIMAFASTIGGLFVFRQLGVNSSKIIISQFFRIPFILQENWSFGKWILFASIAYGMSSLIYSPLIGVVLGVEQAGVFRGMQNFFMPFTQIVTALSLLVTPFLSRKRFKSTEAQFRKVISLLIWASLLVSAIYSGLIILIAHPMIKLVYNNLIYDQNIWIIPYIGLSTILTALDSALGVLNRVKERPFIVFYGKIAGAIAVLAISIPLVINFQMKGALIGLNISLFVEGLTLFLFGDLFNKKLDKLPAIG